MSEKLDSKSKPKSKHKSEPKAEPKPKTSTENKKKPDISRAGKVKGQTFRTQAMMFHETNGRFLFESLKSSIIKNESATVEFPYGNLTLKRTPAINALITEYENKLIADGVDENERQKCISKEFGM